MNEDVRHLRPCDGVLQGNEIFLTPLISTRPLQFWLGLVAEQAKADITFNIGERANGEACFVMTSLISKREAIWKSLDELEPSFNALVKYDVMSHFSEIRRKMC